MTIAYSDFTAAFPEFSNATTYPEGTIAFWITQAYAQLNQWRFGQQLDFAAMLFVAHNVVLSARAAQTAANPTGIVGEASGPVSAKSVGAISKSFDTGATAIEGAGSYNSTSYGQRLYKLMQIYGSGPVYMPGRAASRRFW